MEKDGSPLSDEKQTIQTSLFALLKDFLKTPSPEELHCVLAFILGVGEEKQVQLFFFSRDLFVPLSRIQLCGPFKDSLFFICLVACEKCSLLGA